MVDNIVTARAREATEIALAANIPGIEILANAVITLADMVDEQAQRIRELQQKWCRDHGGGHEYEYAAGTMECIECGFAMSVPGSTDIY